MRDIDRGGASAEGCAGVESLISVSRRRFLAGAVGAAGLPQAPLVARSRPVLQLSSFASAGAAFAAWAQVGGVLEIDADAVLTAPVTVRMKPGLDYRLSVSSPRLLQYVGPRFHWAVCLYSSGENPLALTGPLTIDGGNLVSIPLFLRFEDVRGAARRECLVDGMGVVRGRMEAGRSPVDGSRTNSYGATGLAVSGGFDRLILRNFFVRDITRAAGAGLPNSQGCAGLSVTGAGLRNPRHVLVENFSIANIDSDDAIASSKRGEMDGVIVFQDPEREGTRPVIRNGTIENAAGRAVKVFAPGGGGITQDLQIRRSRPGGSNGSVDIAHQHGDGIVKNIELFYSGSAHRNGTTVIGFSSGSPRDPSYPFGPAVAENISITDTTGVAKQAIFGLQYNIPGDRVSRSFTAARITDAGRSRYLLLPGALGTDHDAQLRLEDVDVDVTTALMASEDPGRRMTLTLHDVTLVRGRNPPVPLKVSYRDRPVPKEMAVRLRTAGRVIGLRPEA